MLDENSLSNRSKGLNMKNKYKIIAVIFAVSLFAVNSANAGMLDWVKKDENNSYLNLEQTWSFDKIYFSVKGGATDTDGDNLAIQETSVSEIINPGISITKTQRVVRKYVVSASAYSSTVDQTDNTPFITASGTHVRDGVIATNFLPFGTIVKIPSLYGNKIFIVEDRMNKRFWYNVDIWLPNRETAIQFGRRTIEIEIVS